MLSRISLLCLLVILLPTALWAQGEDTEDDPLAGLTDWLSIPDFTVEIQLGTGIAPDGAVLGETNRFARNVGMVFCRLDAIGLTQPQELSIVWYREDVQRASQRATFTKAKPNAAVSLNIPAVQAGSWRVEVTDAEDVVLTVAPFVIGAPSISGDQPLKTAPTRP